MRGRSIPPLDCQVLPSCKMKMAGMDRRYARAGRDGTSPQITRQLAGKRMLFGLSPHLTDGRGLWFALRRTSIGCPHDQALSRSKTAMPPGGSPARPKLRESR
jgi:hypothetical protein